VFQKSQKRKEEEEEEEKKVTLNGGNFPSEQNRRIFVSDMDSGGYLPGREGKGGGAVPAPPNLATVLKEDGCPSVFETSTDLKASSALNQFYQPKKALN